MWFNIIHDIKYYAKIHVLYIPIHVLTNAYIGTI